jgi:hypothetical protein
MESQFVELQQHDQQADQPRAGQHEFSLPPADSGKDALLFLLAAFFVETLIWGKVSSHWSFLNSGLFANTVDLLIGFPFSFGIFQEYYSTHEPFVSKPYGIAAIGTTALVSQGGQIFH